MFCKQEYLDPLHTKHEPFPVLLNFCVAPYSSGEPEKSQKQIGPTHSQRSWDVDV